MSGLTALEAARRLQQFGRNEIHSERTRSPVFLFAQQFESPLVIILLFACVISFSLGERLETVAIGSILLINAAIGFLQEYRAETAIAALREITGPRARVLRDGKHSVIFAHDVVPGDLLFVEAGDIVAADAKLLEVSRLQINEALLTGESLPVSKALMPSAEMVVKEDQRISCLYMGTTVLTGTAVAEVMATGMKTELGKIAHLISSAQVELTPLQVQLAKLGRTLLFLCLAVVSVVAALGLYRGMVLSDLLIFAVSLAVAAVPEGLPAIVTVALAIGVQRMAARRALVRKLPSVEALGSVSVICTDKTGTLTTGQMRVRELYGDDKLSLLTAAASCCDAELSSDAQSGTGDPTEIAILVAASEKGILKKDIERRNPRLFTEPFDPELRRMSVRREDGHVYVKGAAEAILPLCALAPGDKSAIALKLSEFASRGLRLLAVASGPEEKAASKDGEQVQVHEREGKLHFLGLLAFADPPRPEVISAVHEARRAGITSVMITGDHPQTAIAIARELGLVLEGEDQADRVHARATPEDKLKLVRLWKEKGAIVAMTGDGVNDAPALREAHVGIAMGLAGTEVTRQAADIVLADDNFATIVAAVREGRGIFDNIRKSVTYLLTGNLAEIVLVMGAVALDQPLPLLALHLLWINLVTDALPALALIADPIAPHIMSRPPRPSGELILGSREWIRVVIVGAIEAVVSLLFYGQLLRAGTVPHARSLVFSTLVLSQLLRAFCARSDTRGVWRSNPFGNPWLVGVAMFTGGVQLALHSFPPAQALLDLGPISIHEFSLMISLALIPSILIEGAKLAIRAKDVPK